MNKAGQLAKDLDAYHTMAIRKESSIELRSLAPMESKCETAIDTIRELRKMCADKEARVKELEGDSVRYQWLKKRIHSADFDYGEDGMCALVFAWPSSVGVGGNLDVNIDAARKALGETK